MIERVIEAYRKADEDQRMSLYLAYPDLREVFVALDAELAAFDDV